MSHWLDFRAFLLILLSRGADFQLAVDANFHHRHNVAAGNCPEFYKPEYFLSKEYVDSVGEHIELQRKKGPKKNYVPKVPDMVVDEDEKSFEAAGENKEKTSGNKHDVKGIAALVCHHDSPIFFVDVDTPGEQQKYAVALIIYFFSLIPEAATAAFLYDVGCVLDRSNNLVSFI